VTKVEKKIKKTHEISIGQLRKNMHGPFYFFFGKTSNCKRAPGRGPASKQKEQGKTCDKGSKGNKGPQTKSNP
jgi:hypothetical protein